MFFKIKRYDKKFTRYYLTDGGIETLGYLIAIGIMITALIIGQFI